MDRSRFAWLVAGAAVAIVLYWQYATVHYNYGGHWIGLFSLGNRWPLPPELASENVGPGQDDPGYDGVFYHLVAHDPWLARGFWRFADNSSLRWRRILLPGLAHIAAVGRDAWIHPAYIAVNLFFIFLGAFWLARYCYSNNLSTWWGLAFLAVPSVLVSIDRLTIDTALAALTVGFIFHASEKNQGRAVFLLALCPLARETGLALAAGMAWERTRQREWRRLWPAIAAVIPFACWSIFVFCNTPHDATSWISFPFVGILRRTLHPLMYPITGPWTATAAVLDYLALLGIWAALALTLRLALKRQTGLLENCIYSFTFGLLWLGKSDIWAGAYEFGRTMSPLLIMLGLLAIRERDRHLLLPLACTIPRILLQFEPQLRGILRNL